jgi:hypothetical protein
MEYILKGADMKGQCKNLSEIRSVRAYCDDTEAGTYPGLQTQGAMAGSTLLLKLWLMIQLCVSLYSTIVCTA